MKHYESDDESPALTNLARQVDELSTEVKKLTTLRSDVEANTRGLARLSDAVNELTESVHAQRTASPWSGDVEGGMPLDGEGSTPPESGALVDPAPNWLTVTDVALAIRWLDDLSMWVSRVWTRYGPTPECWPWHAHVVAELLVCRHQWLDATADGVGADMLAAWHDRWRPGVHHRVTKYLAACERTDGLHVGLRSTRWTYDTAFLEPLAQWWATTHGRDPRTPPPGLTQDHSR